MAPRASVFVLLAVLLHALPGCALWSLPTLNKQSIGDTSFQPSLEPRMRVITGLVPVELDQIQPGEYCEFAITGPISLEKPMVTESPVIAGRVVSTDASNFVLSDSVSIDRTARTIAKPAPFRKVPYLSRLYKNTGVGVETMAIPGEVRIPRKSIAQASTISPEQWPTVRDGGMVRVGIDFDFDGPAIPNRLSR